MAQKIIHINGVNCSHLFKEQGYSVGEKKILGPFSGTMLDGTQTEDLIALKDVLELPLEPLSEEEICSLMTLIREGSKFPYVEIYYFSTNYGAYRTAVFIRGEITNSQYFISNSNTAYYMENKLSFTEC